MRKYTPKDDVQKKAYYDDRFYITPEIAKLHINSDEVFFHDINILKEEIEVLDSFIQKEHLVIYINKEDNLKVLEILKQKLSYEMLVELSAIDYIAQKDGFEVFYELLSLEKRKRVRVKLFMQKDETLNSVYSLFKMANWSEREMYDMFGIKILNHPNMKRILMPDDWHDYPLRKTYPLQGDEAASWYEVDKIFGKEAREIIGPEQRDPAAIDRYDTSRFARLGHDVPKDYPLKEGEELPKNIEDYQEEDGVFLIKSFKRKDSKTLEKRK